MSMYMHLEGKICACKDGHGLRQVLLCACESFVCVRL